ncbi:hypothetical protein AB0I60_10620 [Actinosynnema sp. NPDC050436]|uniref:hypothetical protein n=1 Tax=Actinosynnema sp. NPDC050436 TaxID=3155659 RepID=UPI0033C32B75
MPPKRTGPHLPLAALLLAASVLAVDGPAWVKAALLALAGAAVAVWAAARRRERLRRAADPEPAVPGSALNG